MDLLKDFVEQIGQSVAAQGRFSGDQHMAHCVHTLMINARAWKKDEQSIAAPPAWGDRNKNVTSRGPTFGFFLDLDRML